MKLYSKILAVVALTMLVAAPLYAQKKGSSSKKPAPKAKDSKMYVGGSVAMTLSSLKLSSSNTYSGASFSIMPEFGFNINKKLSVGGSVGFSKGLASFDSFDIADVAGLVNGLASTVTDISSDPEFFSDSSTITGFRFAPYARYTIIAGKILDIFVDGTMSLNAITLTERSTDEDTGKTSTSTDKFTVLEFAARPGFRVKLSDQISFVGHVGALGLSTLKQSDSDRSLTRFGLDVSSSNILFGFQFNL